MVEGCKGGNVGVGVKPPFTKVQCPDGGSTNRVHLRSPFKKKTNPPLPRKYGNLQAEKNLTSAGIEGCPRGRKTACDQRGGIKGCRERDWRGRKEKGYWEKISQTTSSTDHWCIGRWESGGCTKKRHCFVNIDNL